MWIRIGRFLIAACLLFLFSIKSFAEDISFEATVNTNKISLQEAIEFTLTIHGAKGDMNAVPMPALDGFQVRFVGPSTKYLFVNGVSSSERSFIYNLFPTKVGHFQIPAISVTLDNKTYTTNPIDIDVSDKAIQTSSTDADTKSFETLNDKIFLKVLIEPKEYYVGEKIPLTMKVYVTDFGLQLSSAPSLNPDGFTADSTASMQKNREIVNGRSFDTLTFTTNIYPTREGKINVGPFQSQGQLIYEVKQSNDMFADFFGRQESRPINLHADALSIEVKPLPVEGQPANFSGAVGQYDFKASVGPSEVKLGDPLTLRMTISGQGRIKGLTMPTLLGDQFKTYEPKIKEDENTKTLEQVIIPTNQNISEIPALTFNYFDSHDQKYKTIVQGPFPIKITAPSKGEEFKAYGFVDKTKVSADKSSVVSFDGINQLFQYCRGLINQAPTLSRNWRFWLGVVVVGMVWVGLKLWQRFQWRLKNDSVFAKKFNAPYEAKKGIKRSEELLKQNKGQEFYESIFKTLRNYLAHKLHKPLGGISFESIQSELEVAGVDIHVLEMIKQIFERCDQIRFAGAEINSSAMQADLQKLQEIISYLDRKLSLKKG